MEEKDVVLAAVETIGRERPARFAADYLEHSLLARDVRDTGRGGLRVARILSEGPLVVTHGVWGDEPGTVAFDVWRVVDGFIAEHWDGGVAQAERVNPSGRTQLDGPTTPDPRADADASREVVERFAREVLIGGDYAGVADHISPVEYAQHNPIVADGLDGFGAAMASLGEQGIFMTFDRVHQVIAEGDFVFSRSEGGFGGPVIFHDLFRIRDGRIVEHWDVIAPLSAEPLPHGNDPF